MPVDDKEALELKKFIVSNFDQNDISTCGLTFGISSKIKVIIEVKTKRKVKTEKEVYQCSACMTVYDSDYGDSIANIASGVLFENLPSDYKCSVCEASKEAYLLVNL
ncbi:rubredoxin [Mariniflexile sp.]|uniref:rubredoxin n=1 Tax=Mariniflexile sp. TaxID=1979402 RepID=UPI00356779EE